VVGERDFDPSLFSQANVASKKSGVINEISQGSGIWPENVESAVKGLPEGGIIAQSPTFSGYEDTGMFRKGVQQMYGSKAFSKFLQDFPNLKSVQKQKLDLNTIEFPKLAEEFNKYNKEAFDKWATESRGPVIAQTVSKNADGVPKGEWQDLDNEAALLSQGIRGDICIGDPQYGYIDGVANGTMKAYGLRDSKTQAPQLTINVYNKKVPATLPPSENVRNNLKDIWPMLSDEAKGRLKDVFNKAVGHERWGEGLINTADNRHWGNVTDYINVLRDQGRLSSIEGNREALEAYSEFYRIAGMELPPEAFMPTMEKKIDQVRGAHNALEDMPLALRLEADTFINTHLKPQGVKLESQDYKKLRQTIDRDTARGNITTSASGELSLSDDTLDRIARLYAGGEHRKAYGRDFFIEGDMMHTLDRGTTLSGYVGDSPGQLDLRQLGLNQEEGRVRTEIGRRVKGATEPDPKVKALIQALTEKRAAEAAALDAKFSRLVHYSPPRTTTKTVLDPETGEVYWRDSYGDYYRSTLRDDGNLDRSVYLEARGDISREMYRRIKSAVDNARSTRNWAPVPFEERFLEAANNIVDPDSQLSVAMIRELPVVEMNAGGAVGNANQVRVIEVPDGGGVYFLSDDGDYILHAPKLEDGTVAWDQAVDVDVLPERQVAAIKRRLQQQ
jgi:hypothetical protein